MSYRQLQKFTEIMRSVGYTRIISMDNFRKPNFMLISEILYWLVKRYDPKCDISYKIETDVQRVEFLRAIGTYMSRKAHINLNLKRLYQSDGMAIKELLKIANMLYAAHQAKPMQVNKQLNTNDHQFISNVKSIRELAGEITEIGSSLYEAIETEPNLRRKRNIAIQQQYSLYNIRDYLRAENDASQERIEYLLNSKDEYADHEIQLTNAIQRREHESELLRDRLRRLSSYKPAHLIEFQKRSNQMHDLYLQYCESYRNLQFLERELQSYRAEENREIEAEQAKIVRLRKHLDDVAKQQMLGGGDEQVVGNKQFVVQEDDKYNRPTSRRRPQSSNLYGTQPSAAPTAAYTSDTETDDDSQYTSDSAYTSEESDGEGSIYGSEESGEYEEASDETDDEF